MNHSETSIKRNTFWGVPMLIVSIIGVLSYLFYDYISLTAVGLKHVLHVYVMLMLLLGAFQLAADIRYLRKEPGYNNKKELFKLLFLKEGQTGTGIGIVLISVAAGIYFLDKYLFVTGFDVTTYQRGISLFVSVSLAFSIWQFVGDMRNFYHSIHNRKLMKKQSAVVREMRKY